MLVLLSMYVMLCIGLTAGHLRLQTALLSISVGTTCTFYQPLVVLEALALTAAIVVALTVYTFNAARKGANFRYSLGSMLHFSRLILYPCALPAPCRLKH